MALIDSSHEFYRPLATRVCIVISTALWSAFEIFYAKSQFWSLLAVAVCVLCIWTFLINYKEPPQPSADANKEGE